jgi:hypothetical protein
MATSPSSRSTLALTDRFERLGHTLGSRESDHAADLEQARALAAELRSSVAVALEAFHRAVRAAGAPHLKIDLGEVRADDKHLRAVEFDISRGRYRAIVTAKSRGDVTLAGPCHRGKTEGPCRSFPFEARDELEAALGDLLEQVCEEAATP